MKIHHLNCGSMRPYFPRGRAIIYCLLVETNRGLVLVDTGFGLKDYSHPSLLMSLFLTLLGVPRDPEEAAARQVSRLGFEKEDVSHIVMTHLHLDHAGGLRDFPGARVHVCRAEYEAALHPHGLVERAYDRPQWSHAPQWVLHDEFHGHWYGFQCAPLVDGLVPEILMVPLPGHTRGHCGVAIRTASGWLFHCGDAASPLHRATDIYDREDRLRFASVLPECLARIVIGGQVPRLRALVHEHGNEVTGIRSHDALSYHRLRDRESDRGTAAQSHGGPVLA